MNCKFLSLSLLLSIAAGVSVYAESISDDAVTTNITRSFKGTSRKDVHFIRQKDLPATISNSGEYFLCSDLTFPGSGSAITILASEVKLHLGTHSITLTNPNATAITVNNASEVTIESDSISNSSGGTLTGNGIAVNGSEKVLIKNIFTVSSANGLNVAGSSDVRVEHCHFSQASNAGALVTASTNVDFNDTVFVDNGIGLIFSSNSVANQDCKVIGCKFPNSTGTQDLFAQQITGLIIEDSSFSFTNTGIGPNASAVVQFGDVNGLLANDVILRNSTFVNKPVLSQDGLSTISGNAAPQGISLVNGNGYLIENCIVDIVNLATSDAVAADLSAIHLGDGTGVQTASNVVIRNTITQGAPVDGMYPDVGSVGVLIENCICRDSRKLGLFFGGTTDSVMRGNTASNTGTGVNSSNGFGDGINVSDY